ncbi:hypothetical protein CNR22_18325 [Sphingobacteriaceae bacterium]|nr:hypothetical protein CNR22_18325 [Sphingobacteriaceae bacterium]
MPTAISKKIFPFDTNVRPDSAFNIHIISEGYTSQQTFLNDCAKLRDKLFKLSPFNVVKLYTGSLAIHSHFIASSANVTGPQIKTTLNDFSYTAGKTPLDSVYNTANKKLWLNVTSLNSLVGSLSIKHSDQAVALSSTLNPSADPDFVGMGVVFVLLPEQTTLGAADNSLVELEDRNNNLYYFVASSANEHFELTLARGIARSVGLGDEFVLPNASYLAPNASQRETLSKYPNLVVISVFPPQANSVYIPILSFKWKNFMDYNQRLNGLNVYDIDNNPPASNPQKLALHIGGGGFQTQVYRSSYDCIMKRNFGDFTRHLKTPMHSFCPICNEVLRRLLTGRSTAELAVEKSLSKQRLVFDEVNWMSLTKSTGDPTVAQTTITNAPIDNPPEYWQFKYEVNDIVGLRIIDARNAVYQTPGNFQVRKAFDQITFNNLSVVFDDNSSATFSINSAFHTGTAQLFVGEGTRLNSVDSMYQRGYKLVLGYNVGGVCNVKVTLSVVFRGKVNDFDPGGVSGGMKAFPQISFEWQTGGTRKVKTCLGTIRMDVNVLDYDDELTSNPQNFAGFYIDSNQYLKTRKYNTLIPKPFDWAFVFDGYYPNAVSSSNISKQITGVYGPQNTKFSTYRMGKFSHSLQNYYSLKFPRQGDYDSIHIHGNSGKILETLYSGGNVPNNVTVDGIPYSQYTNNSVEAPFCPHNCFHLHWRWAAILADLDTMKKIFPAGDLYIKVPPGYKFRGWSSKGLQSRSNSERGAPMVPPNQELEVEVRHIADNIKRVHYNVSIFNPNPGEKQVIMEHGCSFASGTPFNNHGAVQLMYGVALDDNNCHSIHRVYDKIRFFSPQGNNYEVQIPEGWSTGYLMDLHSQPIAPTSTTVTLENL